MINTPDLWLKYFPFPKAEQHKYDRGHVVVSGGGIDCTGASCLAAISALRIGSGLVTVASPADALVVYATKLTSVMAKAFSNIAEFKELILDPRKNVILLGPGNEVSNVTAEQVNVALSMGKKCVIDAGAIMSFAGRAQDLFNAIKSDVVLTPHEGEFRSIFNYSDNRLEMASNAANESGAVIVLKGHETVISAPDGRRVVNANAPATLATAGSGDVLAGIIAGLMAQGMDAFLAASSAVWIHGKVAELAGIGMISEDLPEMLPLAIRNIAEMK